MNKLVIVRGRPGTGKSTYVRDNFPNVLHLENDMYHYQNGKYMYSGERQMDAVRWCYDTAATALKSGMDVVVANTFVRRAFIEPYKNLAAQVGCEFEVHRMMGNFKNIHNVPADVLENMKNNFEDYPGEKLINPKTNK